jgi:hypothetical protein
MNADHADKTKNSFQYFFIFTPERKRGIPTLFREYVERSRPRLRGLVTTNEMKVYHKDAEKH